MGAQRTKEASQDLTTAGVVSSVALTDIARSMGSNTPKYAAGLGAKLSAGSGFDQIRSFHGLLMACTAIYGGVFYGLSFLEGSSWGLVLGMLFLIVGSVVAFGTALALLLQFGRYGSLRMRCRLWPVETPIPNAGYSVTGHPLTDTLFVTPFKVAMFLLMTPFLLLGMVGEVIRFVLLNMAGKKNISYRGDQGKYYEKVRKEYAKRYHQSGIGAANEYLRIAYCGLLTPIGSEIPSSKWDNGKYKEWLAPMINRHGPITKYCTGQPGIEASNPGDTSDVVSGVRMELKDGEVVDTRKYAKVPDKYSAI